MARIYYNRVKEDLYVKLFNLIKENQDGIISELLSKNMKAILYDFLYFDAKKGKLNGDEYRVLFRLAQTMEDIALRNQKVKNDQGEICETLYELIIGYGKENIDLIEKFIKVLMKIAEQSIREKNYYKFIIEILKELNSIKNHMPELDFYSNINYIIKCLFKNYEEKLDLEGFFNLIKMWHDYLIMKDTEDFTYPLMLKEAHDNALQVYHKKAGDVDLDTYCHFEQAIKEYKDLEFENNIYKIRTPKDPKEMREVGSKLNICVGTYVRAVAKKTSKVLWLCNKEDTPIAALEVKNNRLIQAKTERNHYPEYELEDFIKLWCREKDLEIISY